MKRVVIGVLIALGACGERAPLAAPPPEEPSGCIGSASVSPSSVTLAVGGSVTLSASVTGSGCRIRPVVWSSSDSAIAVVTQNGVVTGLKGGVVTVTAASVDDPNIKAAAVVAVGTFAFESLDVQITGLDAISPDGQSKPANILAVAGTVELGVYVTRAFGATGVTAVIRVGTDSLAQSQTTFLPAGNGRGWYLAFRFNTAAIDSVTQARSLHNGTATATVIATRAGTPAVVSTSITFNLANP